MQTYIEWTTGLQERSRQVLAKQLIVNADDFGRHVFINRAVELGVEKGLIRSATVMVTGAAFEDAIALARRTPALGLGLHFTLVNARPVLPPDQIPSLIDPATNELWPDHGVFVKRFLAGKIRINDVARECQAQLDAFLSTGLVPTHADSHQHMHVLPGIIDVVIGLCLDHGIPAVRIPAIPVSLLATRPGNLGEQVGRMGLHVLAERARRKAVAAGLRAPEHFGGIVAGEAVDKKALRRILLNLKDGTTEIMLHPGTDNKILIPATAWDHDFEGELEAVTDPDMVDLVQQLGITVGNFTNL